jgi:hypothetical protein
MLCLSNRCHWSWVFLSKHTLGLLFRGGLLTRIVSPGSRSPKQRGISRALRPNVQGWTQLEAEVGTRHPDRFSVLQTCVCSIQHPTGHGRVPPTVPGWHTASSEATMWEENASPPRWHQLIHSPTPQASAELLCITGSQVLGTSNRQTDCSPSPWRPCLWQCRS